MDAALGFPALVALIAIALIFDALNGLHDAANSIATVVSTRVLPPQYAVAWAAFFNFIAGSTRLRPTGRRISRRSPRRRPTRWTLTPFPGPQFKNVAENGSAEASYYTWVDQQNTFGLGDNVPLATGNANESLMALVDGKWINMRIPYPLGFFAKWIDGRIDDPSTGWKGRALWSTDGNRTPFHRETGKGTLPKIVKFQMRPDPLAH